MVFEVCADPASSTVAVILSGGKSSRMGQDKATLMLGGRTFLDLTLAAIPPKCRAIIIAAAANQSFPMLDNRITISRDQTPAAGPLEGLASALAVLPEGAEQILLLPCDHPRISAAFLGWLINQPDNCDAAIPRIGNDDFPIPAVYSQAKLRAAISAVRQTGQRSSLHAVIDQLKVRTLCEAEIEQIDPGLLSLQNVNSPEDFQRLLNGGGGLA